VARRFRGWLATWLQDQRRSHLLPAPVLTAIAPGAIAWTWSYPDPVGWDVWQEHEGGNWILEEAMFPGAAREYAPADGDLPTRLVGVNAYGGAATLTSNVVVPSDAGGPPVTLLTDLLAYWRLDEAEAEVRADSSGHFRDLEEADPWSNGAPVVLSPAGILGNAAAFVEWSGWCLTTATLPEFVPGDFAVSVWFRLELGTYTHQGVWCVGGTLQLSVTNTGNMNFALRTSGVEPYLVLETLTASVPEDYWTHCAVVRQDSEVRIYLNGALQAQDTLNGPVLSEAAGPFGATEFAVGVIPSGYPEIGGVDELAVWHRALSPAEVTQLYNDGNALDYEEF
jgi:hypothetical protein